MSELKLVERLEELLERIASRYQEALAPLRHPLVLFLTWLTLTLPPLWPLAVGLLAKLSERALEAISEGREDMPPLSADDLLEAIGYTLILTPLMLFWCSPTVLSLICLWSYSVRAGSSLEGVAIALLIGLFLFPLAITAQLIGFIALPISTLRFLEERDYRYAISISEIAQDFDELKDEMWTITLRFIGDLMLLVVPLEGLLTILLPVMPITIWLILSALAFTLALTVATLNALFRFTTAYADRFLRM